MKGGKKKNQLLRKKGKETWWIGHFVLREEERLRKDKKTGGFALLFLQGKRKPEGLEANGLGKSKRGKKESAGICSKKEKKNRRQGTEKGCT